MNQYSISDIEAFAARFYKDDAGNPIPLLITPYGYTATFLALAQGISATQQLNIAANADFMCLGLSVRAQIGAAQTVSTVTAPFVRLLVTDSGSNEQFTAQGVDVINWASSAQLEHRLSYPRIVAGRSSLTVQATNYAPTAETYTSIDVFFDGVLIRAFR